MTRSDFGHSSSSYLEDLFQPKLNYNCNINESDEKIYHRSKRVSQESITVIEKGAALDS